MRLASTVTQGLLEGVGWQESEEISKFGSERARY